MDIMEIAKTSGMFFFSDGAGTTAALTQAEAIEELQGTRAEFDEEGLILKVYGMVRDIGYDASGELEERYVGRGEAAVEFNDEFSPRNSYVVATNKNGKRYVSISTWLRYME